MDFTLYWFMFPVAMCVATLAMLSGIGGAALFTPIFVLIFPLLGPEYALQGTVVAIGTALLTETFGFTSGFIGYYRKRLIDFAIVFKYLRIAAPVAIAGAFLAHLVPGGLLILGYAVLVLILAIIHIVVQHEEDVASATPPDAESDANLRRKVDSAGREYVYKIPEPGISGGLYTGIGAFLTGMVSVGIGEVIVPQLTKRGVPLPIAVAASVKIVIVTAACASFTLIGQLISEGGFDAIPWNLVAYTIPGVLIGGQIGPRLQTYVSHRVMEYSISTLFIVLAAAMALVGLRKLGVY